MMRVVLMGRWESDFSDPFPIAYVQQGLAPEETAKVLDKHLPDWRDDEEISPENDGCPGFWGSSLHVEEWVWDPPTYEVE